MTLIIYAYLKRKYPRNGNPKMELKKTFPNVVHSLKKDHERKLMGEQSFAHKSLTQKLIFMLLMRAFLGGLESVIL